MTALPPIVEAIVFERIRVVLQPIVDLRRRTVHAYEALVRSTSPHFGSPIELFEAAVRAGCCGELGRSVRKHAVASAPNKPLFLNIHPHELTERWLLQPDDPMFSHNQPVYLEITESVPLTHLALCERVLRDIRARGIHLVIDDLGAGYSNLRYIADLEPSVVKLDRNLIQGLVRNSRTQRLVQSMVEMCSALGASVVAEGIEEPSELDAVIDAGVPYGQGFLLARPAFPAPEVMWPDEDSEDRPSRVRRTSDPKRPGLRRTARRRKAC